MTTNRKTIQVEIDDSPKSPLLVGVGLVFCFSMVPTISALIMFPQAFFHLAGFVLINLVLSILGGILYMKFRPFRRVAFIRLDVEDLIPPQTEDDVVVEAEPEEEPEPEAEEPEDDSPAEPPWFETPYPDPDVELKKDEAPEA